MKTGRIQPRHAILGLALVGAGLLAAFGNKTPAGDIAEPVARPAAPAPRARTPAPAPAAAVAASQPAKASAGQPVLALVPRDALVGGGGSLFGPG